MRPGPLLSMHGPQLCHQLCHPRIAKCTGASHQKIGELSLMGGSSAVFFMPKHSAHSAHPKQNYKGINSAGHALYSMQTGVCPALLCNKCRADSKLPSCLFLYGACHGMGSMGDLHDSPRPMGSQPGMIMTTCFNMFGARLSCVTYRCLKNTLESCSDNCR